MIFRHFCWPLELTLNVLFLLPFVSDTIYPKNEKNLTTFWASRKIRKSRKYNDAKRESDAENVVFGEGLKMTYLEGRQRKKRRKWKNSQVLGGPRVGGSWPRCVTSRNSCGIKIGSYRQSDGKISRMRPRPCVYQRAVQTETVSRQRRRSEYPKYRVTEGKCTSSYSSSVWSFPSVYFRTLSRWSVISSFNENNFSFTFLMLSKRFFSSLNAKIETNLIQFHFFFKYVRTI